MRFLVDANMPRSTTAMLVRLGHIAEHVNDLGLGLAADTIIAGRAKQTASVLITRDIDFADIRQYPPKDFNGIIVLRLPDDAIATVIVSLLERFMKQAELVNRLPGHLVILEMDRVRFRPALF